MYKSFEKILIGKWGITLPSTTFYSCWPNIDGLCDQSKTEVLYLLICQEILKSINRFFCGLVVDFDSEKSFEVRSSRHIDSNWAATCWRNRKFANLNPMPWSLRFPWLLTRLLRTPVSLPTSLDWFLSPVLRFLELPLGKFWGVKNL